MRVGVVAIRWRSDWLAERWGIAPLEQTVRVYPDLQEGRRESLYLVRSRQIALEKRRARRVGAGREFENLRDFISQATSVATSPGWRRPAGESWSPRSTGLREVRRSGSCSTPVGFSAREPASAACSITRDEGPGSEPGRPGSGRSRRLARVGRSVQRRLAPARGAATFEIWSTRSPSSVPMPSRPITRRPRPR